MRSPTRMPAFAAGNPGSTALMVTPLGPTHVVAVLCDRAGCRLSASWMTQTTAKFAQCNQLDDGDPRANRPVTRLRPVRRLRAAKIAVYAGRPVSKMPRPIDVSPPAT